MSSIEFNDLEGETFYFQFQNQVAATQQKSEKIRYINRVRKKISISSKFIREHSK